MAAAIAEIIGAEGHGHPEFCPRVGEQEPGGHHADHRVPVAVERERFPHQAGVGPEAALPQTIAHDHGALPAGVVFFRQEITTEGRLDAQERKEVGGGARALKLFGVTFAHEDE